MTEFETRCLTKYSQWIRSLADDAAALAQLLSSDSLPVEARKLIAGGLNYVFKSLDLIPDGLEGLGFLDDALVIRVASRLALGVPLAKDADLRGVLASLAHDTDLIAEFLEADYPRLVRLVASLTQGASRGRLVAEIAEEPAVRNAFASEVHTWAKGYQAPVFPHDEKNLVKLKSFLTTKLPA